MAYTKTLAAIRTSLLIRGQYENSSDITPTVANEVINDALEESYNLIVEKWDDYYVQVSSTFTTASGTESYALPTDFYKLRKVEILYSGLATDSTARWHRLYPIDIDYNHRRHSLTSKNYRYRIANALLYLSPIPQAVETLRVYYIPTAVQLVNDTDSITFDTPLEFKLVLHIALRDLLQRQDLPTEALDVKIERLVASLRTAADHDAGEPFYLGNRTSDEAYEDDIW